MQATKELKEAIDHVVRAECEFAQMPKTSDAYQLIWWTRRVAERIVWILDALGQEKEE